MSGVPLSGQSQPWLGLAQPWLGLDVGTRRIGVALSNTLGIAQPLLTIERTQPRRDQRSILRLARRHSCAGIIVGNPLHLSGDPAALYVSERAGAEELAAARARLGFDQPLPIQYLNFGS